MMSPSLPGTPRTSASWRSSGCPCWVGWTSWQPHSSSGRARSRRLTPATIAACLGGGGQLCQTPTDDSSSRPAGGPTKSPGSLVPGCTAARGSPATAMPACGSVSRRTEGAERGGSAGRRPTHQPGCQPESLPPAV